MPAVRLAVARRLALVVVPSPPKSLRDVVALLLPGEHAGVPLGVSPRFRPHAASCRFWLFGLPRALHG